jgi:chitodextrinase
VKSSGTQSSLIRLRDSAGTSVAYVFLSANGRIGFRNDVGVGSSSTSSTAPGAGWHALEVHLGVAGASSVVQVWLDGVLVGGLPTTTDLGAAAPIGQLQAGDSVSGSNDLVYDDAAFGTARLGPAGDTSPPTVPANVAASAPTAFSVGLTWDASTDDGGVVGYDVFRNGSPLASLGTVTTYTDSTVLANTAYSYAVRARDGSGNLSALSTAAPVTTPPPAAPVFADGFESGDLTAWTTSAGLVVESTITHSGGFAAEANTTSAGLNVRETISAISDVYGRVWLNIKALSTNATLLGFRSGGSLVGSVFVGSNAKLGVIGVSGSTSLTSTTGISLNTWHALEFHLTGAGASSTSQVWLDGVLVGDLSGTINSATTLDTFQVGDTQGSLRTYDIVYDDAAFGTSRLGP